ncbi:MAG: sulfite exporter TauE/SafE family protein [Spirochaetales bacterium]|nr:sulfite exporter TauE/SafE family protein [Spirochaetales bacterium]
MSLAVFAGVLIISVFTAAVGRGGGNFYVPLLIAAGLPVHQAATTGQLILVTTALSALLVFGFRGTVDWKLALVIDPPTDLMALVGGYFAHRFAGGTLKIVLAALLVASGIMMLLPIKAGAWQRTHGFGWWHRSFREYHYTVNLWITIPVTALVGLVAGMVGISCGSFKIPLMVLLCGVPMRVAVGTSSAMVATTALMGLIGHAAGGDLVASWRIFALAALAAGGGLAGGALSLKTRPEALKLLFALTTLAAAAFVVVNVMTAAASAASAPTAN